MTETVSANTVIAFLGFLLAVCGPAVAQIPVSIGAAGIWHSEFSGVSGEINGTDMSFNQKFSVKGGYVSIEAFTCELGIGYWEGISEIDGHYSLFRNAMKYDVKGLDLSVFVGKYPFRVSGRLTVFPQAGVNYKIFLSIKDNRKVAVSSIGDYNALSFKPGGGMDFHIAEHLSLRLEALFVLRLDNRYERELKKDIESLPISYGPEIKLGLRCKF
jgi:opacity protein-like surface antigen